MPHFRWQARLPLPVQAQRLRRRRAAIVPSLPPLLWQPPFRPWQVIGDDGHKMIKLDQWSRGLLGAGSAMVLLYVVFWFVDVLILGGDYDPLGLIALPFMACLFSALVFWLLIFPVCKLIRCTLNHLYPTQSLALGSILSAVICGLIGIAVGATAGDMAGSLMWGSYGAVSAFLFHHLSATVIEEEAHTRRMHSTLSR